MSLPHHSDPNRERLLDQFLGTAKRKWSMGRVGPDDDGDLAFAIATDVPHKTIVIRFGKAVEWIGLDAESAERLRDELTARLHELRGVTA